MQGKHPDSERVPKVARKNKGILFLRVTPLQSSVVPRRFERRLVAKVAFVGTQGYLAYKKRPSHRTLQKVYA